MYLMQENKKNKSYFEQLGSCQQQWKKNHIDKMKLIFILFIEENLFIKPSTIVLAYQLLRYVS